MFLWIYSYWWVFLLAFMNQHYIYIYIYIYKDNLKYLPGPLYPLLSKIYNHAIQDFDLQGKWFTTVRPGIYFFPLWFHSKISLPKFKTRLHIVSFVVIEPSRWWLSGKNLGSRGLLHLWSQVRALWLLIWWPLEAYMVVNFRARGISRGARKLARTPMLN